MKKYMTFIIAAIMLLLSIPVMAQTDTSSGTDFGAVFGSFAALVAAIPVVVELIKKLLPKMPSWLTQTVSWVIGIAMTMFGWFMHLGFLDGLPWYIALAYGFGASLAANGIADTGLVQWIIGLFSRKTKV